MDIFHIFIHLFEDLKAFIVQRAVLRLRLIYLLDLDPGGDILKFDLTQARCCNPSRPAGICINGIPYLFDLYIHDIRKDLAPYIGLCPAADDVDTARFAPKEFFHRC